MQMLNMKLLPTCFQLRSRCKLVTEASDFYRYKRAKGYLSHNEKVEEGVGC
jgi:hypothetical protein